MELTKIGELLKDNTYPGRGIVIGRNETGDKTYIAYFIMGRSENSRNRIFTPTDDGIRTEAFDPSKMTDPSLIIYHPVRIINGTTIVTNGDQTDTVWNYIKAGKSFEDALMTRTFEPDEPNYTPRISGIVYKGGAFDLSILKSDSGRPENNCRFFFRYDAPVAGEGRFISTYLHDGNPIPSFEGEPKRIAVSGDMKTFSNEVWSALNADNRVSLYGCVIDNATGIVEDSVIINKNK